MEVLAEFVLLVVMALSWYFFMHRTGTDIRTVQSNAAAYTLDADDLDGAYKENEVAADMKYKGRVVVVMGEVESIGKDIMDQAYIVIGGKGFLDGIQCAFPTAEGSAVAQLFNGQFVSVKCNVSGKMGNVQGRECRLGSVLSLPSPLRNHVPARKASGKFVIDYRLVSASRMEGVMYVIVKEHPNDQGLIGLALEVETKHPDVDGWLFRVLEGEDAQLPASKR